MIVLTQLSVPKETVVQTSARFDPLVTSDFDYAVKTWMSATPGCQCRPWQAISQDNTIRIVGWRADPAVPPDKSVYASHRQIAFQPGETLTLSGKLVMLRRTHGKPHDAARGLDEADHRHAYQNWLTERLIDAVPFAVIDRAKIGRITRSRVLRKIRTRHGVSVVNELIPVVTATVDITVRDPAGVEAWLIKGTGPQKAFGYGAFVPTLAGFGPDEATAGTMEDTADV